MRLKPAWFDALFILRPTLFFPAWTAYLAGYRWGQAGWREPFFYLLWLAAAAGASFLLNQIADRREDQGNAKLLPLWGQAVSSPWLYFELGVLILAVALGCVWVGLELAGWLALFAVIAGVLYNVAPFRLKSHPILGIVACSVGGIILFIIGARTVHLNLGFALLKGIPYGFAGAAASLLTHVPDLEGDRAARIRTFPLIYGLRATGIWAVAFVALALLASLWQRDLVLLSAALMALPFFIRFAALRSEESAQTAVKVAIFSLAVAVGVTWWPLLVLIALYYPFARWYHRARLGLEYPSFRSGKLIPGVTSAVPVDPSVEEAELLNENSSPI